MKWNNDRKLRLIWNNIAWLLRNDKIRDQSLFIAWGGGGGSEYFWLNTVKYSRFPLQILFNLSDSPSYLLITFVIPPIGFTPIFTFRRVYLLFYISNYYVLTGNKAVMSKSVKDSLDLCLFWSETRYLMPVDKPAISKSQALEYCKVHTFSEYLAVHQVPSGRAKITLFLFPFPL